MNKRKENPAKVFLRRYTAISGRVDALDRAINQALARATNTGITLKEIKVQSSPAEHDPMARDVCSAVDASEILYRYKAQAETALREILAAIESLEDERQKELLTRRYINGASFREIREAMHYEETQTFVIHGRALIGINQYLQKRGKTDEKNADRDTVL